MMCLPVYRVKGFFLPFIVCAEAFEQSGSSSCLAQMCCVVTSDCDSVDNQRYLVRWNGCDDFFGVFVVVESKRCTVVGSNI
jgi:hypothetical protein